MAEHVADRFQTIIDSSTDGIIIVDTFGYVRFVNPAAEALFGRSSTELLGSMLGFPVGAGEITEMEILRKSGAICFVELRVVEIGWEDELMFLATLRDVTERKLREVEIGNLNTVLGQHVQEQNEELTRLHERLSVIFNTTTDAILLVNSGGTIDLVNPAFAQQFGYDPAEVEAQPLSLIVSEADRELLEAAIRHTVETGAFYRSQSVAQRKDGTTFDIELSLARVVNNDDHLVCNLHDISHFRAVERMKDEFISMVNHELRTPISALLLALDSLQFYYEKMSTTKIMEKLAQSRTMLNRLRETVEGVLELSRIEAQGGIRGTDHIQLQDTLTGVFNELNPSALQKMQTVTICAPTVPIVVKGHELDFTRIWRNLVSNAIKYTPNEGSIVVRVAQLSKGGDNQNALGQFVACSKLTDVFASADRDYVVGQVEDNGHGIHPEDMANLFQRFNRGWAKTSGIPGTGLGLALVQELLNIYEGDIEVSSTLGVGSVFTFWFPLS